MAVRRDRRGKWRYRKVVQLADGTRERISGTSLLNTKLDAERAERAHIARVLSPTNKTTRREVPRFEEFAKEFLGTYATTNNKPSEVQSKKMIVRLHLAPAFDKLRLDEIGQGQIEAFKASQLRAKKSAKTINNHLTVLRRLLAVAVEWGKLEHFPPFRWMKTAEPEFDFLTFEEADRLVAGADDSWRAMVTLGLKAGLRLGELLALRWSDVDLVNGQLVVRRAVARGIVGTPKSGRSREVPLPESAVVALKAQRHLRGELVFCDLGGDLFGKESCKWPLWRAAKRAGLRRIGWHVLRHTFASHLAMRGVPVKVIQELLGHASIEMTMRYAHLSPDVRADAVRLLDRRGNSVATEEGETNNPAASQG